MHSVVNNTQYYTTLHHTTLHYITIHYTPAALLVPDLLGVNNNCTKRVVSGA